jgi:hypothetical protein
MLRDWEFWFQLSDGDKDLFREFILSAAFLTNPDGFFRLLLSHETDCFRKHTPDTARRLRLPRAPQTVGRPGSASLDRVVA